MMARAATQYMLDAFIRCQIGWIVVVPGSGLNPIYEHYSVNSRCIFVTREEEGVALAAGLALAGERPLLLVQQSGVGNSLNAVFTLADAYSIFFPIVVCDRSSNDPNPVQQISSVSTNRVLDSLGSVRIDWEQPDAEAIFRDLLHKRQRWIICTLVGEK